MSGYCYRTLITAETATTVSLVVCDGAQTASVAERGWPDRAYESGPIISRVIGTHPSALAISGFVITHAVTLMAAAHWLPPLRIERKRKWTRLHTPRSPRTSAPRQQPH